jgi:hypothetical protein
MTDQCIAAFRLNREVGQPATLKFRGSRSREELLNDRNSYVGNYSLGGRPVLPESLLVGGLLWME